MLDCYLLIFSIIFLPFLEDLDSAIYTRTNKQDGQTFWKCEISSPRWCKARRRTLLRGDRVSFTSQTLLQTNQHSWKYRKKYRKYRKIQKSLHWLVSVLAFKTNLKKKKLFLKMRMSFRGLTHIPESWYPKGTLNASSYNLQNIMLITENDINGSSP